MIDSLQMGLFYLCFAAFSLGIFLQEGTLLLFLIFQMVVALVYRGNLGAIFGKGRRAAFLFMAAMTVSAVIAQFRMPSEGPTRIHWAFAAFWAVSPVMIAKIRWKLLYHTVLIASAPGMLYSIYWLLRPPELEHALNIGFHFYPRAAGFVSNPITNAEGLVILACWSLSRLSGEMSVRERTWVLAHLLISVLIVVFSRVRAGLLGFSVIFLLSATFSPKLRRFALYFWLGMAVAFIGGITIFGFNTDSLKERLELINNSMTLISRNPIFGIGPNKFKHYPVEGSELALHPHNTLFGIAGESGMVGLAAYLVFMGLITSQLLRIRKRHKDIGDPLHWVAQSLLFTFICYWVFGFFDYNFADSELLIFHALHWALISQLALWHEGGPVPGVTGPDQA